MSPFLRGFASELVKVANPATRFLKRLEESPELRRAIGRGALLGAGTGAVAGGVTHKNGDESRAGRILRNAAVGAVTGGVTGAIHPGWYSKESYLAADEIKKSHARKALPLVGALSTIGSLAHKVLT